MLDALRLLDNTYQVQDTDFNGEGENIEIDVELVLDDEDLQQFHEEGVVSSYKRYDLWMKEFRNRLPSYQENRGILSFCLTVNRNGQKRYSDGVKKHNNYISQVIPKFYYIDSMRHFEAIQEDIFLYQENEWTGRLRDERCLLIRERTAGIVFTVSEKLSRKRRNN